MEDISFGSKLKKLRNQAEYYADGANRLSQETFGQLVGVYFDRADFTRDTVSKWESGETIIRVDERKKLCAIISVLHTCKSIHSRQESDEFLQLGKYGYLDNDEAAMIDSDWVKKDVESEASQPAKPKAAPIEHRIGNAPPLPSLIVGRDDDLIALKGRLIGDRQKAGNLQVLTAIKGWPGVGKTTIASVLAHDPDLAAQFPDGVLWTSLGEEPNIMSEMATWGRALGTNELLLAKSILEAQTHLAALLRPKRMLLIIDDVWQTADALPFRVGGAGCATLVTTRQNDIAEALSPSADNIYCLKVLKDEDALKLLAELAPTVVADYPAESLELVKELEGLPLAIQVAGRLLNTEASSGFNVSKLIDEIRKGAKLLNAPAPADRIDLVKQTTPTIAALLQKSVDRLDANVKDCYAYLGVFAPKPATFDLEAMKSVWMVKRPNIIVQTLLARGLLEYIPETKRYQMHALLVMLAKTLLTDEETALALAGG
jgi:transcriptional regulator with XRE-family HTH domain